MTTATLIVFDVDGTLISDEKDILPETIGVVHELSMVHGVEFVLASARSPKSLEVVSKKLGIDCGYVCFNGAISFYSKNILDTDYSTFETIPEGVDIDLATALLRHNVTVSAFSKDKWSANRHDYWLEREIKGTFLTPDFIGRRELIEFVQLYAIHKFLCRGKAENIKEAKNEISDIVSQGTRLFSDRLTAIEISPSNSSKLAGIIALVNHHRHKAENVWVFGDADNDLDMVRFFENSVAMANGSKALKEAARYVIGSNNEPSIATFLREKLLLM